ncbi:deoxyribodipyrimidine photo-lyase [Methanolinea mesophila]|uniref:deoxyribodipyrimidine photo-lyase n=1 Tax=Methanolinea mesophila TaxID=547055 RepID=UPI001AE58FBF|nr:deoxyribodipyrimidine photo-lyase [Methanolinea mesophila]MBP1929598.1 deoxyribodipyrimidine photo-lyase [Methanolinea mesophila]
MPKDPGSPVSPGRIHPRNSHTLRQGDYVIYWMQASHRTSDNHALEHAISRANRLNLPLIAYFGLTRDYPSANLRHYSFMIQGLAEAARELEARGIRFILRHEDPATGMIALARRASLVVADQGYLRTNREWCDRVSRSVTCPLEQVESNVLVPVTVASGKEEYSAATFRPRISARVPVFLDLPPSLELENQGKLPDVDTLPAEKPEYVLSLLDPDRSVPPVAIRGGAATAASVLERFIRGNLERYARERNDPSVDRSSGLSPYLHFGQVSPGRIAREVMATEGEGRDAFLEQLIVRRELAVNYVYYNSRYDSIDGLPRWAKETLGVHSRDPRDYLYTMDELELGDTHDPYWNAAQRQVRCTGRMHGYMRMYWGKKLLEWSPDPATAFTRAVMLNDRYQLDGRDPNGYAGIAWCFGKHDRPWGERPVFGKVRYMNARGLERKFDMEGYLARVKHECGE